MSNKNLKEKALSYLDAFIEARKTATNAIISLVKENGGFINTTPTETKPEMVACKCYDSCGFDGTTETSTIYGLRYREEDNMLLLCTEEKLEDYEFDHQIEFILPIWESNHDPDLPRHLEKMLADEEYYEDFDGEYFLQSTTIINILSQIGFYL